MSLDPLSETIVSLFRRRVESDAERPALLFRPDKEFLTRTWRQIADEAARTATALLELGLAVGDRVVQVAENRYEWIVLDLAVLLARGVHVAVHAPLAGPQIVYQIVDSGAKIVVVSGKEQTEKLAAVGDMLPPGLAYLSFEPLATTIAGQPVRVLAQLARQQELAAAQQRIAALPPAEPTDLATILYTSGTTGEPKGVMLSHRNLASNALAVATEFPFAPDERRLCWLPLSHIYARTCDYYAWIVTGGELVLAQSRETIIDDCKATAPSFVNGVPYFYEKIMRGLIEKSKADEPDVIRRLLGGKMRLCCAGGAALPEAVAGFFLTRGMPLCQGYGLTETSPVITMSTPDKNRIGCAGRAIGGIELKIAPDGEILTRGPHVMLGYWNKPADTAETIEDGWLHTGDLGSLEDGFLQITGRKKELIVTSAGKNVAPVLLEGLINADPLVAQSIVIGDGRPYLVALIVPDREAITAEIKRQRLWVFTPAQALAHPKVRALYAEVLRRRLAGLSHFEQVGKFSLVDRGFTIERDEMTPTLKLRRGVIAQHFAAEIARMYESEDEPEGTRGWLRSLAQIWKPAKAR